MTYFTREQVSGDAGCSILGRARKYGETSVSDGASVSRPRKQDESSSLAEVEIELTRRAKDDPILLQFRTNPVGPICLGPHIRDVLIELPRARVEIGQSTEALLAAPVDIQCKDLAILAERVIVDSPTQSETATVYLQADGFTGTSMTPVPVTRNQANLFASWPGVESCPWNNFATYLSIEQYGDPQVAEALRRLRKFVIEFRDHGNGALHDPNSR